MHECAEFAGVVIELVIGNYFPLQTITCLYFFKALQITAVASSEITITNYCV